MQRPFRFSVQAFEATSAKEWTELARQAEDLGYSTLFTTDHYFGPGEISATSGHRPVDVAPLNAMISPAPSAPLMCGNSSFNPGQPLRTITSMRLSAAACKRINASPGFGSGVGKSAYSSTSGPPCWRKRTAFIGMIVTD